MDNPNEKAACRLCGNYDTRLLYALEFADVMSCQSCGAGFLHPLPKWEETKLIYDDGDYYFARQPAYFSEMTKDYPEDNPGVVDYKKIVAQFTKLKGRGKLLDVGSATGVFLDVARKDGWDVSGVELSKWASEYSRKEFGLDVFTGTLEQASFPDSSFDVVTMWDVLEHVQDPMGLLKEAKRVLKPNGIIYVNTITYTSILNYIAHAAYKLSFGRFSSPLYRLYGLHHLYYFSKESLYTTIKAAGYQTVVIEMSEYPVERIENVSFLLKIAMDTIYKLQEHTKYRTTVTSIACVEPSPTLERLSFE